jgi:uncharacterized protein (DUF58 family)
VYPTRLLVILVLVPALLSLGLAIERGYLPALLALDALVLAVAACDGFIAWRLRRELAVEVDHPATWSRGRAETMTVRIDHLGRRARRIELAPDLPRAFSAEGVPLALDLPPRSRAETTVRATAHERGGFTLAGVHVALTSPLGLWRRHLRLGAVRAVSVHPDLKQLGEYALLARNDRLSLIGVRRAPRTGGDTEFERLRDYHSDDALNRMDWKATARRDQLTVRDYRTNQSQSLMLMVDAGRMMVSRHQGRDLLDHAIDAALMLAWVAVQQGDRVGLVAYADGVKRYVPAGGGPRQVARLVHALHDLHAERVESRHEDAFLHLAAHERKRSLVVALTHVLDEVNADHLERHLRRLVGRHLPLAVLLQDRDLHDLLPEARELGPRLAAAPDTLWTAGAAASIIGWRHDLIDRLRRHGCLAIDTPPAQLTAGLISRYLEIKARHLL